MEGHLEVAALTTGVGEDVHNVYPAFVRVVVAGHGVDAVGRRESVLDAASDGVEAGRIGHEGLDEQAAPGCRGRATQVRHAC